jgi:hypothetical protein
MSELHVKDNYRTNPLSLQPGGSTVKAIHERGKAFVYDKVKNPGAYIKRINTDERIAEYGAIVEILIDNVSVWTRGSGRQPWEI